MATKYSNLPTVPLPSQSSDGDKSTWPTDSNITPQPHDTYYHGILAKLCPEFLPKGCGEVRFEKMPEGYFTFLKTRQNSTHVDRYLYGHPKGKFDSPNKFAVHFKWLMGGMQGQCECRVCNLSKASGPREPKAPKAPKAPKQPKRDKDEVGATPITRTSMEKVKNAQKYVDHFYKHAHDKKQSMALEYTTGEQEGWEFRVFNHAEEYHPEILEAHSFEPRENEIVLFYTEDLGLYFDHDTQAIGQINADGERGLIPTWKAGRIITTPKPGILAVDDMKYWKTNKDPSKLFEVELVPVGSTSLPPARYTLPLMNLRPFSMVAELLHGLPQIEWDRNITQTGTMSTSLGLVEPCAVWGLMNDSDDDASDDGSGSTRTASIHLLYQCRQMWLGPEKIIQGDVVRLIPEGDVNEGIETALLVTSLGYRMQNLQQAEPDCDAYLIGRHMTTKKPSSATRPFVAASASYEDLESMGLPKSMRGYNWYDVNGERDDSYSVNPQRVVGRCYERVAMQVMVWAGDLDIGLKGIIALRKWGRKHTESVDFIWAAPRHEKGVLFHLDDRLEKGLSRQNSLLSPAQDPKPEPSQNGKPHASEDNKASVFSDAAASDSDHMNKMSIISGRDNDDDDDQTDDFMRDALEHSGETSAKGTDEPSGEEDGVVEVQRRYKKARLS